MRCLDIPRAILVARMEPKAVRLMEDAVLAVFEDVLTPTLDGAEKRRKKDMAGNAECLQNWIKTDVARQKLTRSERDEAVRKLRKGELIELIGLRQINAAAARLLQWRGRHLAGVRRECLSSLTEIGLEKAEIIGPTQRLCRCPCVETQAC